MIIRTTALMIHIKKLINKKSDEFDKNLKFNDYLIINKEWKYNNSNKNKDNKKRNYNEL